MYVCGRRGREGDCLGKGEGHNPGRGRGKCSISIIGIGRERGAMAYVMLETATAKGPTEQRRKQRCVGGGGWGE